MYSITDHGDGTATIFHDGAAIGTVTHKQTTVGGSSQQVRDYVVNGRRVETGTLRRTTFATNLAAGGSVTERDDS